MTCIIGLIDKNGDVYVSGDAAGVDVGSLAISVRSDDKVFRNGPFLIGGTTSFRMLQILKYKLLIPAQTTDQTDMQYMVCTFVDAVRKCFKDDEFTSKDTQFLVGYKGQLYSILADWQVAINSCGYDAAGCGADFAMGAMFANDKLKPEERLKKALLAASTFSAGVCGPFKIMKLESSKPLAKKKVKRA